MTGLNVVVDVDDEDDNHSSTTPTPPIRHNNNKKKQVSFTNIVIHEFALQPGDNPSVTVGVPVALSSILTREMTIDVDKFEKKRRRYRRTSKWDFQLPPQKREHLLLDQGYTKSDIVQTIRKVRKARHARDLSVHNQKWDHFHEVLEQTTRKLKCGLSLKKHSSDLMLLTSSLGEREMPSSSSSSSPTSRETIRPVLVQRPERAV